MIMAGLLCHAISICILLLMFICGGFTEDTTEGRRLYPLPAATPGPAMTIESIVVGPFRVWHIVGFCSSGVLVLLVIVCCCVDVRIPRSKEEIEENFKKRQLNKKYTKAMASSTAIPSAEIKPVSQPPSYLGVAAKRVQVLHKLAPQQQKQQQQQPKRNTNIERPQPGDVFRYPPSIPKSTSYDSAAEQPRRNRNAQAPSEINDYQVRASADISRSAQGDVSGAQGDVSGAPRDRQVSREHAYKNQQNRQNRSSPQDIYANGSSAAQENSQNVQRERIRTPQQQAPVSRQRQYNPDVQEQRRNQEQISKIKRFGIQTPLANHPSAVLGPQRAAQKAAPSLAATARTLAAMNAHPGHLARPKREVPIAYE